MKKACEIVYPLRGLPIQEIKAVLRPEERVSHFVRRAVRTEINHRKMAEYPIVFMVGRPKKNRKKRPK